MRTVLAGTALAVFLGLAPGASSSVARAADRLPEGDSLPAFLKDRGPGIPTSMFGTYVLPGELLVYPFFEHYRDGNAEYKPQELGYGLDQDFRGSFEATEYLLFLAYGLSKNVAVELEAARTAAELEKSPSDPSAVPRELAESGLGDVQVQLDWRWLDERSSRPAAFSFVEVVFPFQRSRTLIGTPEWEVKMGTGVIRGFRWGTATLRAAAEYAPESGKLDLGEYAVEYFKRLSPRWRIYAGIEGTQDEVGLITELQLHLSRRMFFKFNSASGLTSKATDWAPETGVVFRF